MITPDQYDDMLLLREELADIKLEMEALRRLTNFNQDAVITHDDILSEFNISKTELDDVAVVID